MLATSLIRSNAVHIIAAFSVFLTTQISRAATPAPPVIVITHPARNAVERQSPVLLAVNTRDNVAISNVFYTAAASPGWTAASNTSGVTWQAQVNMAPGTNVISVYAVNTNGQSSATNSVTLFFAQTNAVTITNIGKGVMTPNYNGRPLDIGRAYRIHALAQPGWRFTNWLVEYSAGPTNISTPSLTFIMESNLVIVASFVDVERPVLAVTPPLSIRTAGTTATISGHARDNVAVAAVYYEINGAPAVASSTNGFTNWTASFFVTPGTSTVDVWAVDTSGNVSRTNTVRVVSTSAGFAPETVSGMALVTTPPYNATEVTNYFGTNTYAMVSNNDFAAGNYTYALLDSNTVEMIASPFAPSMSLGDSEDLTLSFTSPTNGAYTNSGGGSGVFSLAISPSVAPNSLDGATIVGYDAANFSFTNSLDEGVSTRADSQGNSADGIYNYTVISPQAILLMESLAQTAPGATNSVDVTNYALLLFGAGHGVNQYFTTELGAASQNSDSGVFGLSFATNKPGGVTPASIAGMTAVVTSVSSDNIRSSYVASFSAATFGVFQNNTNGASGVGNYTFTRTGDDTAVIGLTYLAPPAAASNQMAVYLTFARRGAAQFTNDVSHGTITFRRTANLAPVSLVGRTLRLVFPRGVVADDIFGYGTVTSAGLTANSYTYSQFGPQSGLVRIGSNSLNLWFTSTVAGDVVSTSATNDTIGTFRLH